jgi:hypothetical protein
MSFFAFLLRTEIYPVCRHNNNGTIAQSVKMGWLELSSESWRGKDLYRINGSIFHPRFLYMIAFLSELTQGIFLSGIVHHQPLLPTETLQMIWLSSHLGRILGILCNSYLSLIWNPQLGLLSSLSLLLCGVGGLFLSSTASQLSASQFLVGFGSGK